MNTSFTKWLRKPIETAEDKIEYSIDKMLDGSNTNSYGDSLVHAEILRLYRLAGNAERLDYVRRLIMAKRREWLNYRKSK